MEGRGSDRQSQCQVQTCSPYWCRGHWWSEWCWWWWSRRARTSSAWCRHWSRWSWSWSCVQWLDQSGRWSWPRAGEMGGGRRWGGGSRRHEGEVLMLATLLYHSEHWSWYQVWCWWYSLTSSYINHGSFFSLIFQYHFNTLIQEVFLKTEFLEDHVKILIHMKINWFDDASVARLITSISKYLNWLEVDLDTDWRNLKSKTGKCHLVYLFFVNSMLSLIDCHSQNDPGWE